MVGQYVTKEARREQAQQVKASHFQLGYVKEDDSHKRGIEEENLKKKWKPEAAAPTSNLAKSNFSLGASTKFTATSMSQGAFQNHGAAFDPRAKEKRLELLNELRKSNLPS